MRAHRSHRRTASFPRVAIVVALSLAAAAATSRDPATPVFEDGQAQVVPAFADSTDWIREELWVETELDTDGDGRPDRVRVAVARPGQTRTEGLKVPVVFESSPYYSGTSGDRSYLWDVRQEVGGQPPPRASQPPVERRIRPFISDRHVEDWVPRGFAVVHSEAPGTGLSQGCPTVGGPAESLAPRAVIDWLNGRARGFSTVDGDKEVVADWSTGKVGMTGTSYNGTLALAAATTGVEGLEAIIPLAPNTSYYRYYRSNGLVRHPGGWLGEDIDFLYDFINSGDPARRAWCDRHVRDGDMAAKDRVTGDYNDFWAGRDLLRHLDGVRAATLMAHAFNDWNVVPEHSVVVYEALKARAVPVMAYYHQGGHGGPPPFELMNRWFTRYLYDVDNGVEALPRAWIVREEDPRDQPTAYPDYPHPDARLVRLHPGAADTAAGGLLGVGGLTPERRSGQGAQTLVDNVSFAGDALARAEWSSHRLLFATAELTEPLHVSGTPRVSVRLASDRPAANLSVWLVSLPWDERGPTTHNLITRGWADPRNRESLWESEPLVPGEFYDVRFDLQPDDQVIRAGQRIGLMVFSSDRDFTLWPRPGAELTVDLDATHLELPVVGGPEALSRSLRPAG
jgi:X-Pro dipeptidyl-peptidase